MWDPRHLSWIPPWDQPRTSTPPIDVSSPSVDLPQMSNPPEKQHIPQEEGSDLSGASTAAGSTTAAYQRHGYHRTPSQGDLDFAASLPLVFSTLDDDPDRPAQGLGISKQPTSSFVRVPVGSRAPISPPTPSMPSFTPNISSNASPITPQSPGYTKPLLSPRFQRHGSGPFTYDGGGLDIMREEDDISGGKAAVINDHEVREDSEGISMHNDNDHTRMLQLVASSLSTTNLLLRPC
jgi:hypothetical protein